MVANLHKRRNLRREVIFGVCFSRREENLFLRMNSAIRNRILFRVVEHVCCQGYVVHIVRRGEISIMLIKNSCRTTPGFMVFYP